MNENQKKEFGTFEEILASFNDPYGRPLSCAHRSYWRMYPENSVPSILAAIRKGNDCIELDVHATKDGMCVLTHDGTLSRCTDAPPEIGRKKVSELYYDEIKDLHLRFATGGSSALVTDEKICTLETAIKLCEGHIMINLDKVMYEDEYLRDCTYNELLRLTKLGYHPFEYCMFKLAKFPAEDVAKWIREKKEQDGVDIIYVPWGPAGAQKMMDLGYTPPIYEYGYDIDEETKLKYKEAGVGYFANTFEGCGQDNEAGWRRLFKMGVNAIHNDEADWLPKIIRSEYGEHYNLEGNVLVSYSGATGDMILRAGIEKIGDGVFKGIAKLRTMILPADVKSIGTEAFADCGALTDIFVPETVVEIGADAFANCKALTIHVESGSFAEKYAAENKLNYRVCEEYTKKYEFAFEENNLILTKCYDDSEDIILPDTLLGHEIYEVGRNALRGCSAKSVTFGKYVRMIEQHCLADCPNLICVRFGEMVNAIAVTAFENFNRELIFECKPGSYPFRYASVIGITRIDPDNPILPAIDNIEGIGTDSDPYIIKSIDDIKNITEKMNSDIYGLYSRGCFKLAADIKLDPAVPNNFPMIGSEATAFNGIFDGCGHTIEGARVKVDAIGSGIFGRVLNAKISNLNVVDIESESYFDAAGFVGTAKNTSFENCHVSNFAATSIANGSECYTGGFIADSQGCSFVDCTAIGGSVKGARDVGGFAGNFAGKSTAHRCCAEVDDFEVASNSSAGFLGNIRSNCKVTSCYATASGKGKQKIGGFTGHSNGYCLVENCFAIGVPSSVNNGIIGGFAATKLGTVNNCYYNEAAAAGSGEGTAISLEKLNSKEFLDSFCADFVPGATHPVFKK